MTMTINGSGTITGLTAGGLPSATVTQATLATPVAGTGPAFSAYPNATQSISSGVYTKIQCNTKEFDTANCYDATTNYRFTPNTPGYYQVSGSIGLATTAQSAIVSIYKNGSQAKQGTVSLGSAATYPYSTVSALIYMNGTTDYLELYVLSPGGAFSTWSANPSNNYFQASMVRSA